MRVLLILDPLPQIQTYKDTSYAMMVAASARGHEIHVCGPGELWFDGAEVCVAATRLELQPAGQADWYRLSEPDEQPLQYFDATLMRKDPPFDLEYLYATMLLERAVAQGARVFNDPRAIRDHNEKLAITEFPQFAAQTIVTRDPKRLRAFVKEHGQAIFKLLDGMGGTSIFQAREGDANLSVIIETMNQFGARSVMAQRYLPEISEGDKRILLIAGEVVPFSLARIPQKGESRGNLAAGGTGRAQPLSARDREIAEALAQPLWERGLLLVGLDVIGGCLTEINVTSPTCFQEITQQTGYDVAEQFVTALEAAVAR